MTRIKHLNRIISSRHSGLRFCDILFIGWLVLACQQTTVNVSEPPAGPLNIATILVLPFQDLSGLPGEQPDARSPVSGRVFATGEVAATAPDFLTDLLVGWLRTHSRYTVITSGGPHDAEPILSAVGNALVLNRDVLNKLSRETGADAVMLNYIYRFKERVGKGISAESPASVAFDMHLMRLADGRLIWSANFDETQQSLGQNLFQLGTFLSRGGRWITAEEMADSGIKKILAKFPTS